MKYRKEFIMCISCFLLALLLSVGYIQKGNESLAARIAPEILRFHVLANSDSSNDQQLKLEVRTLLLNAMYDSLGENATKDDTCNYISQQHKELERLAENYIREQGYHYPVQIELAQTYFPTKTYGDMVFPCGTYQAARVTIGEGKGQNWWCVLYPPLCFIDSTYAVVPDESRKTLEHLLTEDDFEALMQTRPLKPEPMKAHGIPEDKDEKVKIQVKLKLAELFSND